MNTANYAIIDLKKYEGRGAASTALGTTKEGLVPMPRNDTPTDNSIPYGYCHCGCGEKTTIADSSWAARGNVKGEPKRYVKGHNAGHDEPTLKRIGLALRKPRPVPIVSADGSHALIPINSTKHKGLIAKVDIGDAEAMCEHRWSMRGSYARATIDGRGVTMHRLLMEFPDAVVDHINGDGLDNRRSNLRLATVQGNNANRHVMASGKTSRFRGVGWHSKRKHWTAQITVNDKTQHLGRFDDEVDAALAYDKAAIENFGEFALPNFPRPQGESDEQ